MKSVPCGRLVTLVDEGDHHWLARFRWFAIPSKGTHYAYRTVRRDGKNVNIRLHRELLRAPPNMLVDHINGDGLDNRRSNLRLASPVENARFKLRKAANKTSRFKGVYWNRALSKWHASIMTNGRNMHLGYFADETEAQASYACAAVELFGSFAAPLVEEGK